jgi:hypothetical protein
LDPATTLPTCIQVLNAALDDVPRVARHAAWALCCLGEQMGALVDDTTGASPWSSALLALFTHLIQRADKYVWMRGRVRALLACVRV